VRANAVRTRVCSSRARGDAPSAFGVVIRHRGRVLGDGHERTTPALPTDAFARRIKFIQSERAMKMKMMTAGLERATNAH